MSKHRSKPKSNRIRLAHPIIALIHTIVHTKLVMHFSVMYVVYEMLVAKYGPTWPYENTIIESMYVHMYVCMYVWICMQLCTYVWKLNICMYAWNCLKMNMCMYVCMYVRMYVCMYVLYIWICITPTYIHWYIGAQEESSCVPGQSDEREQGAAGEDRRAMYVCMYRYMLWYTTCIHLSEQ